MDRPEGVAVHVLEPSTVPNSPPAAAQKLIGAVRSATIGAAQADAPIEYVFGEVTSVVIGPGDRIFVLDTRLDNVRLFDREGEFLGTVGSPGQGPGEIYAPRSMAIDARSRSIYIGQMVRELDAFRIRSDDSAEHTTMIRVPSVDPEAICVDHEGDFVVAAAGSAHEGLLHIFDETGELQRAFGRLYSSPNRAVNATLEIPLVVCHPAEDLVILAGQNVGEVRGYDLEGRIRWIAAAPAFIDAAYFFEEGIMVGASQPDYYYQLKALTFLDPATVMAQIVRYGAVGDSYELTEVQSFAIGTGDGRVTDLGTQLPLIAAVGDTFFVALEGDLDPQLGVYDFQE